MACSGLRSYKLSFFFPRAVFSTARSGGWGGRVAIAVERFWACFARPQSVKTKPCIPRTGMSPSDWAAWVGAAAWSVPLGKVIRNRLRRPRVRILPDAWARLGFFSMGPGFNLRLMFSVDEHDVILDGLGLLLRHDDGETHTFRWWQLDENFSQIDDASGGRSTVSRQQTPIALKLHHYTLVDNFVRFVEPHYLEVGEP